MAAFPLATALFLLTGVVCCKSCCWQYKSRKVDPKDESRSRLIRVWTVTAISPRTRRRLGRWENS